MRLSQFDIIHHLRHGLAGANDERPLYRKLRDEIEAAIGEGLLGQGTYIPSERALSVELGLSRVTVRKAIDELSDRGVLIRRHGSKTVVATRVEKTLSGLTSFSEDMRSRGMEPGAKWLSLSGLEADPERIVVTGGAQHGMLTALAALTRPGDRVATEALSYPGIKLAARLLGLRLDEIGRAHV